MVLVVFIIDFVLRLYHYEPVVTKKGIFVVSIIFIYCIAEIYGNILNWVTVNLNSMILMLLTFFGLLLSAYKVNGSKSLDLFIIYSAVTVLISILLVYSSSLEFSIHPARGREVFGLFQLTYFFMNPLVMQYS